MAKRRRATIQSEALLQKLVTRAIRRDDLLGVIVDDAGLKAMSERSQTGVLPQFSIDHLCRLAALRAGGSVLKALNFLELLVSDQNVSIDTTEVLRPDIVCINPEMENLVIFELKKTTQTGRQAVTELLAYEQEIKNLLPFLSRYDTSFVLISTEWSPLMDHAVSGAITWSGRNVLCLTASISGKEKLQLNTRVPAAWTGTGSVYFPEDAFPSVTLCLYEKDAYAPGSERLDRSKDDPETFDPRLLTALEVIAREGDRIGGHGFAVLWKDHLDISLTRHNLTICGVSPFAFYQATRTRDIIRESDGRLVKPLDRYIRSADPAGHTGALMAAAMSAHSILKEICDPHFEGFSTWERDLSVLRHRAQPLQCDFWGALGDFARSYVVNPAVREHRRVALLGGLADWRHPRVAMPLIAGLTRPDILADGDVRCSDAFRLGVLIGMDRVLRFNIRKRAESGTDATLRCRFDWNRMDLMSAIDEVRLLTDSAENVAAPAKPLMFYGDPLVDDEEDHRHFMEWLVAEFLQKSFAHTLFLDIGMKGAMAFDQSALDLASSELPAELLEAIDKPLKLAIALVLAGLAEQETGGVLDEQGRREYRYLLKALGLGKRHSGQQINALQVEKLVSVSSFIVRSADKVVDSVFHRHFPLGPVDVDWEWFQEGVSEMRRRGQTDAGVILLANGRLVTGSVLPDDIKMPIQISDPVNEVPFLDRSHGIGIMRVVKWEELKSGAAFVPRTTAAKRGAASATNQDGSKQP